MVIFKNRASKQAGLLTLLTLGLVCNFQACSPVSTSVDELASRNNGEPYAGLSSVYRSLDPNQPCTTLDRFGKALPNDEILFRPDNQNVIHPYLSRQDCQDVTPALIASADLQIASNNTLVYKSRSFTNSNPPGPFDLLIAPCPSGKTVLSHPNPINEFASPLNWSAAPLGQNGIFAGWYEYLGIGVSLYNTLMSLPGYLIERNDANNLSGYDRLSQWIYPQANTNYSFTFLVQAGSIAAVDWYFYRNMTGGSASPADQSVKLSFNLLTLSTTIDYAQNITGVSGIVSSVGNGVFQCTVYFTSSATNDQAPFTDIGITPSNFSTSTDPDGNLGDSIIATDAQLVPVNEICQ